jgi:MFS family permease
LFFLPEPDKVDQQSGDSVPKMPGIVYLYTALVFVAMMPVVPLMLNMSSFMETTKLGDAAAAGLVLAMFTVGGMIAGVIFSQIYKLFKRNTISFGIVLLAAAMVCMIYGSTILFMFMASLFAGIGITIIIPAIFMILGTKVHPARMSTVSGLVLSAINVVGIPTPYIFTFISKLFNQTDNFKFPYMLGIICYAILIIGYMLIKPKTIDKTQVQ